MPGVRVRVVLCQILKSKASLFFPSQKKKKEKESCEEISPLHPRPATPGKKGSRKGTGMSAFKSIARTRPALLERAASSSYRTPFPRSSKPFSSGPPIASTSQLRIDATRKRMGLRVAAGERGIATGTQENDGGIPEKENEFAQLLAELEAEDYSNVPADVIASTQVSSRSKPSPPPPTPVLSPSTLLRPSFPAGPPTQSDITAFRPRRLAIPTIDTPDSRRILYQRSWKLGEMNLERAFNKVQLRALLGPKAKGGLGLDFLDPRWRASIRTREATKTYWKPKTIEQMTKSELVKAVLILHWDMPDPETLPKKVEGPTITERESTGKRIWLISSHQRLTIYFRNPPFKPDDLPSLESWSVAPPILLQ